MGGALDGEKQQHLSHSFSFSRIMRKTFSRSSSLDAKYAIAPNSRVEKLEMACAIYRDRTGEERQTLRQTDEERDRSGRMRETEKLKYRKVDVGHQI